MARVARVIEEVNPRLGGAMKDLGGVHPRGRDLPWEVEVNGKRLTSRHIVIATGARPPGTRTAGAGRGFPPHLRHPLAVTARAPCHLLVLEEAPSAASWPRAWPCLASPVTLAGARPSAAAPGR